MGRLWLSGPDTLEFYAAGASGKLIFVGTSEVSDAADQCAAKSAAVEADFGLGGALVTGQGGPDGRCAQSDRGRAARDGRRLPAQAQRALIATLAAARDAWHVEALRVVIPAVCVLLALDQRHSTDTGGNHTEP